MITVNTVVSFPPTYLLSAHTFQHRATTLQPRTHFIITHGVKNISYDFSKLYLFLNHSLFPSLQLINKLDHTLVLKPVSASPIPSEGF